MSDQVGTPAQAKILYSADNHGPIHLVLPTEGADYVPLVGEAVELTSSGTVQATAGSVTQVGYVVSVQKLGTDARRATVQTPFAKVVRGTAGSAGCDPGVLVKVDTTEQAADNVLTYEAAAQGDEACGIVLKGGADNATIEVGLFPQTVTTP